MPPLPRWRLAVRLLLFSASVFVLFGGPFSIQVLGRKSEILRSWRMFSGFGTDMCTVRYQQVLADGERKTVDRYALLGYPDPAKAPKSVRLIEGKEAVMSTGKRLCKKLGANADVRVHSRCASRSGWKTVAKGGDNLCLATKEAGSK